MGTRLGQAAGKQPPAASQPSGVEAAPQGDEEAEDAAVGQENVGPNVGAAAAGHQGKAGAPPPRKRTKAGSATAATAHQVLV